MRAVDPAAVKVSKSETRIKLLRPTLTLGILESANKNPILRGLRLNIAAASLRDTSSLETLPTFGVVLIVNTSYVDLFFWGLAKIRATSFL
jgi:hypothetical protein